MGLLGEYFISLDHSFSDKQDRNEYGGFFRRSELGVREYMEEVYAVSMSCLVQGLLWTFSGLWYHKSTFQVTNETAKGVCSNHYASFLLRHWVSWHPLSHCGVSLFVCSLYFCGFIVFYSMYCRGRHLKWDLAELHSNPISDINLPFGLCQLLHI